MLCLKRFQVASRPLCRCIKTKEFYLYSFVRSTNMAANYFVILLHWDWVKTFDYVIVLLSTRLSQSKMFLYNVMIIYKYSYSLGFLFKNLHFIYDTSKQLSVELVIEHCDKPLSPPLQFILPENISSFLTDETAVNEMSRRTG